MRSYRFAICDDEPAELAHLEDIARQWAASGGNAAHIARFPSAEAFLFHYVGDKTYDILLLDIEMGKMTGVDLARAVRAENKEIQIIFVTGDMEYISDGYEVEALHCLLKPVTREKLSAVLDRAAERLKRNERALLLILAARECAFPFTSCDTLMCSATTSPYTLASPILLRPR